MKYLSKCADETINIAKNLGKTLSGGEVILFNGDLGAGKTTHNKIRGKTYENFNQTETLKVWR